MKQKKGKIKRIFTVLLSLLMAVSFLVTAEPKMIRAATGEISYIDRNWDSSSYQVVETRKTYDGVYYLIDDLSSESSGFIEVITTGWWYAENDKTFNYRLKISGDVHMIIGYGTDLICKKGIEVSAGSTLTIYVQSDSTSTFTAQLPSDAGGAAIGGNDGSTGGTVIIKGGNFYAEGSHKSAGLGGGNNATFEKVEIYGGDITAFGGEGAGPGIGNGGDYRGSASGEVIIYGGEVYAHGGSGAAGIGGGTEAYGVKTTIWGGTIKAEGTSYGNGGGAGIGGGSNRGQARDIYIYGGTIEAIGGERGAAGIGGGDAGSGAKVVIDGKPGVVCSVKATGGQHAAGIGGGAGENTDGGNVTFNSGVLEAIANRGTSIGAISSCPAIGGRSSVGDLSIVDSAKVTYADSEDGTMTIALKNERKSKAQSKIYAKLDGCEHSDCDYTEIDAFTHQAICKHCLAYNAVEEHTYDGDSTICNKLCGFEGLTVTLDPGINGSGTIQNIKVRPGEYEVPECEFTSTLASKPYFKQWWMSSGGEIIGAKQPGDTVDLTQDAQFVPEWTDEVPVNGVSLNKSETEIITGGEETLVATVSPADAYNKNVSWSSSDESVATVDQDGNVTAVADGTAIITVTTQQGGYTATCTVTVKHLTVSLQTVDTAGDAGARWYVEESPGTQTQPEAVAPGTEILIEVTEDPDEAVIKEVYYIAEGSDEKVYASKRRASTSLYETTMPEKSIIIYAVFEEPVPVAHDITIDKENCTVTVSPESATAGTTVSVTISPDEGSTFDSFAVTADSGNVDYTQGSDQYSYTFTMPDEDVTVHAVCKHVHTPGDVKIENEVPATCTSNGSYEEVVYCSVCEEELKRTFVPVPAFGHDWGAWQVIKEPTYTETGLKRRVCNNDPTHFQEEVIPVKPYSVPDTSTK